MTAEERVKAINSKQEVAKLDLSAHMLFAAELRSALRTARQDGVRKEMDRSDIVKSVVTKRIPYFAKSFYEKETRMRKKKPLFRMTLEHLIEVVSDKAQSLKAQGIVSKPTKTQTVKVVAMETGGTRSGPTKQGFPKPFNQLVAQSPPKTQHPLPTKASCEFCNLGHHSKECPTFLKWLVTDKYNEMFKRQMCFNCIEKGHKRTESVCIIISIYFTKKEQMDKTLKDEQEGIISKIRTVNEDSTKDQITTTDLKIQELTRTGRRAETPQPTTVKGACQRIRVAQNVQKKSI